MRYEINLNTTSLQESAGNGCSQAQYELARRLIHKCGEPLTIVKWLRRAAAQHHTKAMVLLGRWFLGQFDSDFRSQAIDVLQSRFWFKKALKHGQAEAWEGLGDCCFAESFFDSAFQNYLKATSFDNTRAMLKAARCFQEMSSDKADSNSQYIKWVTLAAELGNAEAQFHLAMYFKQAATVSNHIELFEHWLRASAAQGFYLGLKALSDIYYSGYLSIKKDYHKALTWTLQLAQQGNREAYERIAEIYRYGRGIEKNLAKAEKYANEALWLKSSTRESFILPLLSNF